MDDEPTNEAMSMSAVQGMMKKGMSADEMLAKMTDSGMSEEEARAMIAKARQMMKESEQEAEVTEATFDAGYPIFEAVKGSEGKEWDVTLIVAGKSKNRRNYGAAILTEAAPLYEGVPAFADHDTDEEFRKRPERSIKDKVGVYRNVRMESVTVDGKPRMAMRARFKVIAPWLRTNLLEAYQAGESSFYGFSHNIFAQSKAETVDGETVEDIKKILKVRSVDVVTDPSAGGRLDRLVASNRPDEQEQEGDSEVTPEEIKAMVEAALKESIPTIVTAVREAAPPPSEPDALQKITEQLEAIKEANRIVENSRRVEEALSAVTGLSDPAKDLLRKRFKVTTERRDVTDEELKGAIQESVDYEAALAQRFGNPVGAGIPRGTVGDGTYDKMYKAVEGMFENTDIDGIPRFKSLKEGYCKWNSRSYWDVSPQEYLLGFKTTYSSSVDHKKVQESIQTSDWASVFADVLYNRMLKAFMVDDFQRWRPLASEITSFNDFRSHNWTRTGGYADLSSVSEQGTYQPLTSPGDENTNFQLTKYGGLDDITWEAILNDHIGAVRQLPTKMGRAAARTLYKDVLDLITTDDPTLDYDSTALWSHSNSGTSALTLAGVNSAMIAMRDMTPYGTSAEVLGPFNNPRWFIGPNELSARAKRIFKGSGKYGAMVLDSDAAASNDGTGLDPEAFVDLGVDVFIHDYLTNASTYYLMADPAKVDTFMVGFLNGNESPELFVQDQENIGSTFTADKITWKVRHVWGVNIMDHRSFYRQVPS